MSLLSPQSLLVSELKEYLKSRQYVLKNHPHQHCFRVHEGEKMETHGKAQAGGSAAIMLSLTDCVCNSLGSTLNELLLAADCA